MIAARRSRQVRGVVLELKKRLGHDGVHCQEGDGQHDQQHRGDGKLDSFLIA